MLSMNEKISKSAVNSMCALILKVSQTIEKRYLQEEFLYFLDEMETEFKIKNEKNESTLHFIRTSIASELDICGYLDESDPEEFAVENLFRFLGFKNFEEAKEKSTFFRMVIDCLNENKVVN